MRTGARVGGPHNHIRSSVVFAFLARTLRSSAVGRFALTHWSLTGDAAEAPCAGGGENADEDPRDECGRFRWLEPAVSRRSAGLVELALRWEPVTESWRE